MKLVIVMRNDLNMRKGKMIAQGGHAVQYLMDAYIKLGVEISSVREIVTSEKLSKWRTIRDWMENHDSRKIVLQASAEQIADIIGKAKVDLYTVYDKGYTEVPENTLTCIALGPDVDSAIDVYTKDLKLL